MSPYVMPELPAPLPSLRDISALRESIRKGLWRRHTTGLADQVVQGNVVILPQWLASEFFQFCRTNAQACPLLWAGSPGEWSLPRLGTGIDIRTDLPLYRVWRHGELASEVTEIGTLWRPDFVTFVIGCSFSFEQALKQAGLPLRHVEQRGNVPMYRTSRATQAFGAFRGPLVVSMRPIPAAQVPQAVAISARFPHFHGGPVHVGDPAALGIADLDRPCYGDAVKLAAGDVPVFWACGVTSQAALESARPELCITHAPGCMLITDLPHQTLPGD